ncbi:MAG: alpha/beta fold hydrolase [Planctomycetota bacterium]
MSGSRNPVARVESTKHAAHSQATLDKRRLLIVHGFGVATCVFRPLLQRLNDAAVSAQLFRYPSVGLELGEIVSRLSKYLEESRPDAIIAHSLGCIAVWLAAHDAQRRGRLVFLAPPLKTLPVTRLIPSMMRFPFAPLLDHRALFSASAFDLPTLSGCTIRTISGRNDYLVPISCTRHPDVTDARMTIHTHNSMLFSRRVADLSRDWILSEIS